MICSGDPDNAEAMVKLMAWQIQNIGKPSRVIVMLKSRAHQVGKGILLGETLLPIYGPSGFAPSAADKVIGKFNDAVRGMSFVFLDEVLFAGDKRAADSIKRLSTATSDSIEGKGVPVIMCPIGVNIYLATNHENAAFIEEGDARYWALNVSEHCVGNATYFADLLHEIENGGREAFAHRLLNMDVSGFVPLRDVPKDNVAKQDLIRFSINPYDARKWLEDCCETGCTVGRKDPEDSGRWVRWATGEKVPFYVLHHAYVEWQKTVKSPVAPEPTHAIALGKVLTSAGFRDTPDKDLKRPHFP